MFRKRKKTILDIIVKSQLFISENLTRNLNDLDFQWNLYRTLLSIMRSRRSLRINEKAGHAENINWIKLFSFRLKPETPQDTILRHGGGAREGGMQKERFSSPMTRLPVVCWIFVALAAFPQGRKVKRDKKEKAQSRRRGEGASSTRVLFRIRAEQVSSPSRNRILFPFY